MIIVPYMPPDLSLAMPEDLKKNDKITEYTKYDANNKVINKWYKDKNTNEWKAVSPEEIEWLNKQIKPVYIATPKSPALTKAEKLSFEQEENLRKAEEMLAKLRMSLAKEE